MDTHGDRGALPLNTVKHFTYQLLNVSATVTTYKLTPGYRLLSREPGAPP